MVNHIALTSQRLKWLYVETIFLREWISDKNTEYYNLRCKGLRPTGQTSWFWFSNFISCHQDTPYILSFQKFAALKFQEKWVLLRHDLDKPYNVNIHVRHDVPRQLTLSGWSQSCCWKSQMSLAHSQEMSRCQSKHLKQEPEAIWKVGVTTLHNLHEYFTQTSFRNA